MRTSLACICSSTIRFFTYILRIKNLKNGIHAIFCLIVCAAFLTLLSPTNVTGEEHVNNSPREEMLRHMQSLGWREFKFAKGPYTSVCLDRNRCFDETIAENLLKWNKTSLGVAKSENEQLDDYIESLIKQSKPDNLEVHMDGSHPRKDITFFDRAFVKYRNVANKIFGIPPPSISINQFQHIGIFSVCIGWGCLTFVDFRDRQHKLEMEGSAIDSENNEFTLLLSRRYSIEKFESMNPDLSKIDPNWPKIVLSQNLIITNGMIEKFNCTVHFGGKFKLYKQHIAACYLNSLGFLGKVDSEKHMLENNGTIRINPAVLKTIM